METETIETRAHITDDGTLNLSVKVGLPNTDVAVVVHVRSLTPKAELDANGWPKGYFERVAGSMPELKRPPQGHFEERIAWE